MTPSRRLSRPPRGSTILSAVAAFLAGAAVALPPVAAGRGGLEAVLAGVSGARFRAHVEFLADDLLEGREAGTRGYDIAARYVATELETLGLEPAGAGGSFLQPVPLLESRLVEGSLGLARDGKSVDLVRGEDFLMRGDLRRTETRVSAPVVFAGYGVFAPALGHDDYGDVDVRGKVIALLPDSPERFSSEERAHFASRQLKAYEAARRGAVGVLLLHTPEAERRSPWKRFAGQSSGTATTWTSPDGVPEDAPGALAGRATLGPSGVEKLFALARLDVETAAAAARASKGRPIDLGVVATLETRSEHRRFTSPNVVGRLAGSDPALARTHVLYTAHLDHEGVGPPVDGDAIYNGAYDNASGSAVLLETARALAEARPRPRRSVLFAFVTAEEKGLLGSEFLAAHPTVPAESLVANVNVDMPLFLFPVADVLAYGADSSTLGDVARAAARHQGLELSPDPVPEQNLFIRSDQYSFVKRGVPALFLMTGTRSTDSSVDAAARWREFLTRHYHTPTDDLGRPMDLPSAERFIRTVVEIGWTVARSSEPPRWTQGDFFARTFARTRAD